MLRTCRSSRNHKEGAGTRTEQDRIKTELSKVSHHDGPNGLDNEAKRIADIMWTLGERLSHGEPAVLREILQQMVSRIVCRWEPTETKTGKTRHILAGGTVELQDLDLLSCLSGNAAHVLTS